MKVKSLKKFIACFVLATLLLSFLLPCFESVSLVAATVISKESTTVTEESQKPRGFKIENAEYWDYNENYDKSRIWIDQGSGGSGSGGGAGDDANSTGGNGGTSNDAGGILGKAAGVGLGTGNQQNISGVGGSNQGSGTGSGQSGGQGNGSTGSDIADALRALRAEIEESRAESIAKVLESALNQSLVAASIAESESIAESIQKKLRQDAVKSRVLPKETVPPETTVQIYEQKPNMYQANTQVPKAETQPQMPTADLSQMFSSERNQNVRVGNIFIRETTVHEVDAVQMIKIEVDNNIETVTAPTSVDPRNQLAPEEQFIDTGFEPADFIETEAAVEAVNVPTPETSEPEQKKEETTKAKDDDEEEGSGAKGGEDAEADEDKEGDDGSNESEGNAADKGEFHKEESAEFAGKKIFELDANGNIGLNPDRMSNISARFVIIVVSITLFMIGGIAYIFSTRDKKSKKNYF